MISALYGDYQDVGSTHVAAVNYEFDAPGPAGRLVAVTIVNHAYTGPEYEEMLASRKSAAAAIAGPLQQTSATELVASGPGCQLRLRPNAGIFVHLRGVSVAELMRLVPAEGVGGEFVMWGNPRVLGVRVESVSGGSHHECLPASASA